MEGWEGGRELGDGQMCGWMHHFQYILTEHFPSCSTCATWRLTTSFWISDMCPFIIRGKKDVG